MQFKRANCYILPRNDLLAQKRQAEIVSFFFHSFFRDKNSSAEARYENPMRQALRW